MITVLGHFQDLRAPRDAFKYRRLIECRRSTKANPVDAAHAEISREERSEAQIIADWKERVWLNEARRRAKAA